MADTETTRLPVPLLDGERAQEHEDLERELAETLSTWFNRNATICEHTQLISFGEAAEALMKVAGLRIAEVRDQYEQAYDTLVRRTQEWKDEQAARVAAEQHAAQADAERDAHAHLLEHWADEHIILQVVSGEPVHAAWCYRCRIEKAETEAEQLRKELDLAMGPRMYADVQKILDDAIGAGPNDGAGAGLVADVALLAERMKAAEAEAERLEAEGIDRMADRFMEQTRIRSMEIRNGMNLDLEPARELVAEWVGTARAMLGDATNYSETRIDIPTDDDPKVSMEVKLAGELERYAFVLQRVGGMTPHEARMKAEAERDELRAEVEERGKALADWQRVAGQHQAAMFDAKASAEQLQRALTFMTDVMAGTALLGADDAIGMLHELVPVLVDVDALTTDQAARVKDGLNAQQADRNRLADQAERAGDLKLIRFAIADPGAFVKRERFNDDDHETVPAWSARAVMAALKNGAPRG